jgi:hypothetical protein
MLRNINKFIAAAMLGAGIVAVSGCSANLPTRVTRYQAMPAAQGQSFFVVPGQGAQGSGLEFQRFAALVSQQLAARGYRASASPQQADMIVQLGYNVDDGRQVIVQDPFYRSRYGYFGGRYDPFYGPYYGRPFYSRFGYYGARSPFYYGWDDPYWYGGPIVQNYTEYRSQLDLDIRDRRTNQSLFQGRAQARSQTDELGTLVPNLVEAMFTGFPGRSGETVKITVPAKKRG